MQKSDRYSTCVLVEPTQVCVAISYMRRYIVLYNHLNNTIKYKSNTYQLF